jgi:hypothetical protein
MRKGHQAEFYLDLYFAFEGVHIELDVGFQLPKNCFYFYWPFALVSQPQFTVSFSRAFAFSSFRLGLIFNLRLPRLYGTCPAADNLRIVFAL